MIAVRVIVGVLAVVGVAAVLASMLRTIVLPRGVPARLARAAFLTVYWLLRLRLRLTGRSDYATRDRIFASEAVLDGSALVLTACDVPRQSRGELCLRAGIHALISIADFLGIPHRPPEAGAEIMLSQEKFNTAFSHLESIGVPMRDDRDSAWVAFRALRARYEPLLAVLGRMTDAPRSGWSSWSADTPRHYPPLLRPRRPRDSAG